jgi:hypothetical protein
MRFGDFSIIKERTSFLIIKKSGGNEMSAMLSPVNEHPPYFSYINDTAPTLDISHNEIELSFRRNGVSILLIIEKNEFITESRVFLK